MDNELVAQINTLLQNTSDEVRHVVLNGEIDSSVVTLTNTYHLTVTEAVALKNTILLTLLGVIHTDALRQTLQKELSLPPEDVERLLKDIDEGIFEKARIKLFGKEEESGHEVRTLTVGEDESKDKLREQILAQTDRNSAIKTSPVAPPENASENKKSSPIIPGSRSELLERMNVLEVIPKTEEIEERLAKIQTQIKTKEEEKRKEEEPIVYPAHPTPEKTKVSFPEHYITDPYREVPS